MITGVVQLFFTANYDTFSIQNISIISHYHLYFCTVQSKDPFECCFVAVSTIPARPRGQDLCIRPEWRLLKDVADLILSLFVELRKEQLSNGAQCRSHGPRLSAVIWSSIWWTQQHQSQP